MEAIFTIVAKNYLSLARTLGDSIKKHHPDIPFYIIIADQIGNSVNKEGEIYSIIEASELPILNLADLAFKYNVTEYCTALKPFAFDYFFQTLKFEKVIYFDPDIAVFNKLDLIIEKLEDNFIVLTPHFFTPEIEYTGAVTESGILYGGIYNLGFVAIKNTENGNLIIKWWANRLQDKAYADKIDGYHTDQKWMDFVPSFFDKGVYILRKLGYNMAIWNLHERFLCLSDKKEYFVKARLNQSDEERLVFFHFAGFDPNDLTLIHKHHPHFKLKDFPELTSLMEWYKISLLKNEFESFIKKPYSFGFFDTGESITHFHRRLYRSLTENGYTYSDPFSSGTESFYEICRRNKILSKVGKNIDSINKSNLEGVDRKMHLINKGMLSLKNLLGFEKYSLLLKYLFRSSRPENQTFLIKEVHNQIGLIPEEAYPKNYVCKIKNMSIT